MDPNGPALGRRTGLATAAALAVTLAGFGVNAVAGITSGVTRATYHLDRSWRSGYQATYTVANTGRSDVAGWRLEFDLPPSARLTGLWGGSASSSAAGRGSGNAACFTIT